MIEEIKKILEMSVKFHEFYDSDNSVVSALNNLTLNELDAIKKDLLLRLKDRPINQCRLKVVDQLLVDGVITSENIENIKSEITAKEGKNVFQAWGRYFRLFYTFFYNPNKQEFKRKLNDLANRLIVDLDLSDIAKIKIVGFDGAQSQGSVNSWVAIYNRNQPKQSTSLQLFVNFDADIISYGLYHHITKGYITKKIVSAKAFSYEGLKQFLEESRQDIVDDNNLLLGEVDGDSEKNNTELIAEINSILFGPPGTGKTYNTVNKAINIISPDFIEMLNSEDLSEVEMRAIIKEKFDGHIRTGNIAFTTFHQSYGYEDFVEGIKAETIDNQVNYSVEPGIFKQLCEKASANIERVADESDFQLGNKRVWKMSLGNSQTDEGDSVFQECRSNSYVLLGYGDDIDFSGCDSHQKVKDKYISSGYEPKNQDYSVSSVHTFINKIKVGDIIVVSDGNHRYRAIAEVTGEYRKLVDDRDHWFQMRSVKWHVVFNPSQQRENICKKAFSQMTLYELKTNTLDRTALQELLVPKNMSEDGDKQPYVLIIDEINRGNISKIFGELITLIEPDKREGEAEALTVILPYSKEPFSVPKNVHIIGTMNTADASIAKLDVALRRRFKFTEMPPEPSLLRTVNFIIDDNNEIDINLKSMLIAINQRIELLYDRDHTIGHSFFMKLTNGRPIADLASIFEKEIIPLLQEYFFDDWERIHWVLDAYKANDEFWFIRKKKNAIDVMGGRWKSDTNQSALADVWELNLNDNRELTQEPEAYIGIYSESVNKPKSDQAEK